MKLRPTAKTFLTEILKALDRPLVGRDVSTAEWREILEEVQVAVASRLECLDDEQAE
jgi:hypothetical protein